MLSHQRKQFLLQRLKRDGQLVATPLSVELGVSEDTIRRDLRDLAAEGLLQRVHGGALPSSQALADFAGRERLAPEQKAAIGRAASALVRPGQVVFIDGGTSAVQLARALDRELRATVVTHSPSVAIELVAHPHIEVLLIGGRLFKHSVVSVGASTADAIGRVRADTYFMGVSGIHPEAGLSTGDSEEASVKRALMANAAETVVLASSEKLGVACAYVVAPISSATTLVVSHDVSKSALQPYRRLGVQVLQAPRP
jgi:DeoR/GlpR family transcriptional regulator of sugar metabolism